MAQFLRNGLVVNLHLRVTLLYPSVFTLFVVGRELIPRVRLYLKKRERLDEFTCYSMLGVGHCCFDSPNSSGTVRRSDQSEHEVPAVRLIVLSPEPPRQFPRGSLRTEETQNARGVGSLLVR